MGKFSLPVNKLGRTFIDLYCLKPKQARKKQAVLLLYGTNLAFIDTL